MLISGNYARKHQHKDPRTVVVALIFVPRFFFIQNSYPTNLSNIQMLYNNRSNQIGKLKNVLHFVATNKISVDLQTKSTYIIRRNA